MSTSGTYNFNPSLGELTLYAYQLIGIRPTAILQEFPTTFWFDRLLSPTVTLWPVPDGSQTSLTYYSVYRLQDANMNGTQEVDLPAIWLEAMVYGLAERLAQIWAPDKVALMKPMADESYAIAAAQNIETAQQYISPQISSYFRP